MKSYTLIGTLFFFVLPKPAYGNSDNTEEVMGDCICNHCLLQIAIEYPIGFAAAINLYFHYVQKKTATLPNSHYEVLPTKKNSEGNP